MPLTDHHIDLLVLVLVENNESLAGIMFCGSFMLFLSCFRYACVHVCLLMAGKRLTSWLSLVMSNCVVVTFPLVLWVRCGA